MSDTLDEMSSLLSSTTLVGTGMISGRLLDLLGQLFIINVLSAAAFGEIAYTYAFVLTVGEIVSFGLQTGVARVLPASKRGRRQEIIGSVLLLGCCSGLLGAILFFVFREPVGSALAGRAPESLLTLFTLGLAVYPLSRVTVGCLRGVGNTAGRVLAWDLLPRLVGFVAFLLFSLVGRPYLGAILFWLVLPFVTVPAGLSALARHSDLQWSTASRPSFDAVRELLSFSWPLAISTSFVLLMTNFDAIMVGVLGDPTAVGHYRSLKPLQDATLLFLTASGFLYLPIATEKLQTGESVDISNVYASITKWVMVSTTPIVLVMALYPESVIRVLLGSKHTPASAALVALTVGMFMRVVVGPNGTTITALGRTKISMYATLVGMAANVVLNLALIPTYGILGAAVATSTGFLLFNAVETSAVYWLVGIQPFRRNLVVPVGTTIVIAVLATRWVGVSRLDIVGLIAIVGFVSAISLLSVVVTGSLDDTDVRLGRLLGRKIGLDDDVFHLFDG